MRFTYCFCLCRVIVFNVTRVRSSYGGLQTAFGTGFLPLLRRHFTYHGSVLTWASSGEAGAGKWRTTSCEAGCGRAQGRREVWTWPRPRRGFAVACELAHFLTRFPNPWSCFLRSLREATLPVIRFGRCRVAVLGAERWRVIAFLRFSAVQFLKLCLQFLVGCKISFQRHFWSGIFTFIYF